MTSSIEIYSDVIVPTSVIEAGMRGKQMRKNRRANAENGQMKINVEWSNTLRRYEWGSIPLDIATWQQLEGLFEITDAGAYGMLMPDPKDVIVAETAGLMYPYAASGLVGAIGVGYGVPTYKLYKRYSSLGTTRTKDRAITRPQATPVLKRAGATVTYGVSAGNAALSLTTGIVTFVADSSAAVSSVTAGATTSVTLASALAGLAIGQRLYLTGIGGADAALLNGLSHAITNITGGGSNVYTLSTNTAGKTITASGNGFKYPQAADALIWSGRFYVPVHFESDEIDWELLRAGDESDRMMVGPSIVLMEVRE